MSNLTFDAVKAALIAIGERENLYFVMWSGHTGQYFIALRNDRKLETNVYSAIFESYYDLTMDDKVVCRFNFNYEDSVMDILNSSLDRLQTRFYGQEK